MFNRFYTMYYRLYTIFIDFLYFLCYSFQRKHFFLGKKGPCGKTHTRQNVFTYFSSKKKPLQENAHTAKHFYVFSLKKGPCGKMHTRQNMFTYFSKKKAPAGKCTHGEIFLRIFLPKKGPCGKMYTRQKYSNHFLLFCKNKDDESLTLGAPSVGVVYVDTLGRCQKSIGDTN